MTGPHGAQPTAARQGAVCAPMPAGKPSAELEEILQQVLQGLSRGEESGAALRVAVLLDRPQPHLSNWLGPALGACELIVCMMQEEQEEQDGCPEAEPVEYSGLIGPARVVAFTNQVDLHQALATHGRFDVLVDALTHSPGMRAPSAQLFIGIVRDGGYYVAIDGAALGESPNTAGLITWASRSLAGLHGAEGELSGDERSYGEQVAALTVLDGGVVLRKRGDGFVKLRYAETPPILASPGGGRWRPSPPASPRWRSLASPTTRDCAPRGFRARTGSPRPPSWSTGTCASPPARCLSRIISCCPTPSAWPRPSGWSTRR